MSSYRDLSVEFNDLIIKKLPEFRGLYNLGDDWMLFDSKLLDDLIKEITYGACMCRLHAQYLTNAFGKRSSVPQDKYNDLLVGINQIYTTLKFVYKTAQELKYKEFMLESEGSNDNSV